MSDFGSHISLYGVAPFPGSPVIPWDTKDAGGNRPLPVVPETTTGSVRWLPPVAPNELRPEVVAGLAAMLPELRDAIKASGRKLSADEVAAMAWLEGLAAGRAKP